MKNTKTNSIPAIALFCILLLTGFTLMENIIEKLGMQHQYAQRSILNNLIGRQNHNEIDESDNEDSSSDLIYNQAKSFTIPYARMLPSVVQGDKVAATKEICQYVKDYVHSDKFLTDYADARKSATPTSEPTPMDPAIVAELKKAIKEQEAEMKKVKASKQLPTNIIQKMEESINEQKKVIAASDDPTPNKTRWQKLYPENPAVVVKTRLEEYLKLSATVDFGATLVDNGKQKKFENPAYEKKSLKWKAIYRAGKDVNIATTDFVKEWLRLGINLSSVHTVPTDDSPSDIKKVNNDNNPKPVSNDTEDAKSTPAKGFKSLKEKTKKIFN